MRNKAELIAENAEYVIIEQGRQDAADSPRDWAICINRDAGFGGFQASAEDYSESLLDALKTGKALSDLHGLPLVLADCATDELIRLLSPAPCDVVAAPATPPVPAPVVTGSMVIGQLRGTLKPGHSANDLLQAMGDVLESPCVIAVSEIPTRWLRNPAKDVWLYAGCPYADDGEPYVLVSGTGTTDGTPLAPEDMDVIAAHATCIGLDVEYPDSAKYGIPDEASLDGALQLIAESRLSVAALGVHLHDEFCINSNDRQDDGAMQVWFRLQIPSGLCLADGSPL